MSNNNDKLDPAIQTGRPVENVDDYEREKIEITANGIMKALTTLLSIKNLKEALGKRGYMTPVAQGEENMGNLRHPGGPVEKFVNPLFGLVMDAHYKIHVSALAGGLDRETDMEIREEVMRSTIRAVVRLLTETAREGENAIARDELRKIVKQFQV